MLHSQSNSRVVRTALLVISTPVSACIPMIGMIVGMNGGNIWPWVIASACFYAVELTSVPIFAWRDYRARQLSPELERRSTLAARRKAARTAEQTAARVRSDNTTPVVATPAE